MAIDLGDVRVRKAKSFFNKIHLAHGWLAYKPEISLKGHLEEHIASSETV